LVELVRSSHPTEARFAVLCLGDEAGELAEEVREAGVPVHTLGFVGLRARSLLGPFRLARALRRERPDIVYAFLFWGYTLALPVAALASPKALRVAARRSTPEGDVARRLARPLRRLADLVSNAVVANSAEVAEAWLTAYPALRGRMHVIPNGVSIMPRVTPKPDGACPVIVCVANLIAYKGHVTLLEAASLLAQRRIPFRLQLVGDGPERSALKTMVTQLRLSAHVEFLGRRDDVPALLTASDLAVLPSYTEGLPNAVMEAMAAGLPVVATAVGGTPSLLAGGAGATVTPRDPVALADALEEFLRDPRRRAAAGAIGRRAAQERYSVTVMRDRTLGLFREMLAATRRS
jgi:glycosyltransferase involved in cell wall biosynthesis